MRRSHKETLRCRAGDLECLLLTEWREAVVVDLEAICYGQLVLDACFVSVLKLRAIGLISILLLLPIGLSYGDTKNLHEMFLIETAAPSCSHTEPGPLDAA